MNIFETIQHETKERMFLYHYDSKHTVLNIDIDGNCIASVLASDFMMTELVRTLDIFNPSKRMFNIDPDVSIKNRIRFSIKSKVGQPQILNFATKFKISGMAEDMVAVISNIRHSKEHVMAVERYNTPLEEVCRLEFIEFLNAERTGCEAFQENLDLVHPRLPEIVSAMLYSFLENDNTYIYDITNIIIRKNPCNVSIPELKYPCIIKNLLYAAYCGMTASVLWDGVGNINGEFITVDDKGDIITRYDFESEAFKTYLFYNSYLDFLSDDAEDGDCTRIYQENRHYYVNLGFQIRIA